MYKKIVSTVKTAFLPVLFLVFFFLAWEAYAYFGNVDRIIVPAFSEVIKAGIENMPELLSNLLVTINESIVAFLVGSVLAFLSAVVFVLLKPVKNTLLPIAIAVKAMPVITLVPIIILWFGNGFESKVIIGILVAFFPVLVNSIKGLEEIDEEKLDLFRSYSASKLQILLKLRIPNSLPYVFSSLKIASAYAVVGVVIGEYIGSVNGLGHVIVISSYYLEIPLMFASIMLVALWGMVFYGIILVLEKLLVEKGVLTRRL